MQHTSDPTRFWFRYIPLIPSCAKIILRAVLAGAVIFHGTNIIFGAIALIFNGTFPIVTCLQLMTRPLKFRRCSECEFVSLIFPAAAKRVSKFNQNYSRYRQFQIINTVQNMVFGFILPVTLMVGLIAGCLVGYILIKLIGRVPIPLTGMAGFIIFFIIAAVYCLFPIAVRIRTVSGEFKRYCSLQDISKYERQQVKSWRSLGVEVGHFFTIVTSSRTTFISLLLYYMILLVISV